MTNTLTLDHIVADNLAPGLIDRLPHVNLRAFNLTPGATFLTEDPDGDHPFAVWIVMQVTRHVDNEMVWAWLRRADLITEGPGDMIPTQTIMVDFNQPVALIGYCVNPNDPDDNDWGSEGGTL